MHEFIMYKDQPVIEIDEYVCRVLDYNHTPYPLRTAGVTYDDIYHGWTDAFSAEIVVARNFNTRNGCKGMDLER